MSLKSDKEKSQYLQDLIKKTYLTDVIERNHIQKDISILDDLLKIVASIVVVRSHIVPWYDVNGIYYIGLDDFCLDYIDELDRTL